MIKIETYTLALAIRQKTKIKINTKKIEMKSCGNYLEAARYYRDFYEYFPDFTLSLSTL